MGTKLEAKFSLRADRKIVEQTTFYGAIIHAKNNPKGCFFCHELGEFVGGESTSTSYVFGYQMRCLRIFHLFRIVLRPNRE